MMVQRMIWNSLNKTVSHSVNEIGIGRGLPNRSHVARNLPAMVSRVHDHVSQDVQNGTSPRLALAVLIRDALEKIPSSCQFQVLVPLSIEVGSLSFTTGKVRLWPDRNALWDLPKPFQPNPLCRKDVRHKL